MDAPITVDRLRFLLFSLKEKLWVKPLSLCLLSIAAVFTSKLADGTALAQHLPKVEQASVETLLSIMASSMLVIATFSAGTMVSAYSSASRSSTPRSVSLIISDDASQNALSTFVGAFIFSVVAITVSSNNFFEDAGIFLLFCLTCLVFAIVILTFIRWVDSVARLGRVGSTVQKVEAAAMRAINHRLSTPRLGGKQQPKSVKEQGGDTSKYQTLTTDSIGYVQMVDMAKIQAWAEEQDTQVHIAMLPGQFCTPDRPLCYIESVKQKHSVDNSKNKSSDKVDGKSNEKNNKSVLLSAFQIGSERSFEADPRYGLVVLSEIASRALSPSVNDPGTAISILGSYARLFIQWAQKENENEADNIKYHNVTVPDISTEDMFDDAFTGVARDGASMIEVSIRMQKTLDAIAKTSNAKVSNAATEHAKTAYERSIDALTYDGDKEALNAIVNKLNHKNSNQ
ncbi:DUF2254 domain-containing protein [Alteromonas stellipolaris]|uniref:DUF2254 domain-containing protein n=1 Tax=Alteromonas stellipolaris TaxID=233316 RepID=UPI001D666B02|nr:DUF2254 domain-containing protein [Alteromonas stellipolaris]MBZ2162378.1 DUF2254 domain-containing protein [Alteromonas stellipolaris]